ncbi:hypothetical protein Vretimale_8582 [Volvox reticuliferus]|uniref:Pherophorin domain-containing protein n=1 Tax=Volvox reticuliferus TaxID=1737510 RepID=A0A8J4LMU5_9CHLO|nr:hypothetical protein Vretifemale_6522 [Volvox reticuliferus]GIM03917.1 hypothetical protein Vretimale_8582 [Volvox reticuliferus]
MFVIRLRLYFPILTRSQMARLVTTHVVYMALLLGTCWPLSTVNGQAVLSMDSRQSGKFPLFPYANCIRDGGVYGLAPSVSDLGGGKYCFTIIVDDQSCTGSCCSSDLNKIMLNVANSCLVSGASVSATLDGVPLVRPSPSFDAPADGPSGSGIIRIPGLALNKTTAQGAELCITLKANNAGQGCTKLEQLCASPASSCTGSCSAAFFDTTCKCCPVSTTTGNCTPPPPKPAANCTGLVCFTAELTPPDVDVRPYRFDAAVCDKLTDVLMTQLENTELGTSTLSSFLSLELDARCSETLYSICANFTTDYKEAFVENITTALAAAAEKVLNPLLEEVSGTVCEPELDRYKVVVSTFSEKCVTFDNATSITCFVSNDKPPCLCNSTQGILPFVISARYYAQPGSRPSTTEYCFNISNLPQGKVVPSNCAGIATINKLEFYADEGLRTYIRGFTLYPATGSSAKISAIWGSKYTDTLKATNINWTAEQANGGRICAVLQNPVTMMDLCIGEISDNCLVAIYNGNRDCCPTFATGFAP